MAQGCNYWREECFSAFRSGAMCDRAMCDRFRVICVIEITSEDRAAEEILKAMNVRVWGTEWDSEQIHKFALCSSRKHNANTQLPWPCSYFLLKSLCLQMQTFK